MPALVEQLEIHAARTSENAKERLRQQKTGSDLVAQKLKHAISFSVELLASRTILDAQEKVEGIASSRSGGIGYRKETLFSQPAQIPSTESQRIKSEPWVAPSSTRRHAAPAANKSFNRNGHYLTGDSIFYRARGILNKLTPERFDKLSLEFLNVGIDSEKTLRGLILLIFEKAVDEPKFCSLYAKLCERLSKDAPNFEPQTLKANTFTQLLLTKCQDEFESRSKITESIQSNTLSDEERDYFAKAKRKMLGNIRFIGELGKLEVVHEGILHRCIQQLLEKKRGLNLADQVEDLECLCQILRTVGKRLDSEKAKLWMDQYFARMMTLAKSNELPSRIRFMLQDIIDMRLSSWEARNAKREMGPQTIGEIRQGFNQAKQPIENGNSAYFGRGPVGGAGLVDIFGRPMTKNSSSASLDGLDRQSRPQSPASSLTKGADGRLESEVSCETSDQDRWERDLLRSDTAKVHQESKDTKGKFEMNVKSKESSVRLPSKTIVPMVSEKITFRPGASFTQAFKPTSPNRLPKSTRSTNTATEPVKEVPLFSKPNSVIIRQDIKPKVKKASDNKITNGQLEKSLNETSKADQFMLSSAELWLSSETNSKIDNLCQLFRDMELSEATKVKLVLKLTNQALASKSNESIDKLCDLLTQLSVANIINASALEKTVPGICDELEKQELSLPDVKLHVAMLLSRLVSADILSVSAVCKCFGDGRAHPTVLLFLQKLAMGKGAEWLCAEINSKKISCLSFMPACRADTDVLDELKEYGLEMLMPALILQKQFWQQINEDPNPTTLYKWIMKNTSIQKSGNNEQLTKTLFKTLLKYITNQTCLKEADVSKLPDKSSLEQEKVLFEKYQNVMLRIVQESESQQMTALYALQTFCYEHNFPKGFMLRAFTYLYELEIIDEEVFLKWKEDLDEQHLGKGKALFEVNQWLTWLEQAESESDEE